MKKRATQSCDDLGGGIIGLRVFFLPLILPYFPPFSVFCTFFRWEEGIEGGEEGRKRRLMASGIANAGWRKPLFVPPFPNHTFPRCEDTVLKIKLPRFHKHIFIKNKNGVFEFFPIWEMNLFLFFKLSTFLYVASLGNSKVCGA